MSASPKKSSFSSTVEPDFKVLTATATCKMNEMEEETLSTGSKLDCFDRQKEVRRRNNETNEKQYVENLIKYHAKFEEASRN